MKRTTIHISYDEEKLAALNMYLAQKDLNLEAGLQDYLNTLYMRHVPANVREYVAMRSDESPEPFVPKQRKRKPIDPKAVEAAQVES